jgi:hypothetical protein
MKYKYLHLIFIAVLIPGSLPAQGWKRTFPDLSQPFTVRQTPDGGAAFAATMQGTTGARDMVVVKTDADGMPQWEKTIGGPGDDEGRSLALTSDQCLVVTGRKSFMPNNGDVFLAKMTMSGAVLWEYTYDFGVLDDPRVVQQTPGGGFIVAIDADNSMRLMKTDGDGTVLWSQIYPQTAGQSVNSLEVTPDGGFLVTLLQSNLPLVAPIAHVIKTDSSGLVIFHKSFQHLSSYSTADIAKARPCGTDQYLLVHRDSVYRLDTTGNLLQAFRVGPPANFYLTDVLPDPDGGFRAFGTSYSFATTPYSGLWFGRIRPDNAQVWERSIDTPNYLHTTLAAESLADGGALLTGFFVQNGTYFSYLFRTDTAGQIFANQIAGNVFWDKNQDCTVMPADPSLPSWIVKITHPNGEIFYAMTDNTGNYQAETGKGLHTVAIFPPNSLWETDCAQNISVQFDAGFEQTQVDFPISHNADCPLAWVDESMANWIPCFENTVAIRYANQGTIVAPDAAIYLTFDSLLAFTSASIPWTQTDLRTYRFALGNLAPLQNGAFNVQVTPACDGLTTGQSRCAQVKIAPDAPCLSPLDGPLIVVAGRCDADGVHFLVENKGAGMDAALNFVIIEDNIMFLQPTPFLLGPGENATFSFPANGATWRFEAYQASGTPDWESDDRIAAVVEGCTTNGAFSTGFVNQYSLFDGGTFSETECREVVDVPDDTGKAAFPSGYEAEHFISANTDLEYVLYFRNSTSTTVQMVVLRDTLDAALLNVASIQPGPSSHPYRLTVTGTGILVFRFDSIALSPDAQGWVKFRIAQRPDLPNGTIIRNSATVGFDFDAPVTTNETYHTITGSPLTGVKNPAPALPAFSAYPVPSADAVFMEMPRSGSYRIVVRDLFGRVVLEKKFEGRRIILEGPALPPGVFFATVWERGRQVGTVRVIKL